MASDQDENAYLIQLVRFSAEKLLAGVPKTTVIAILEDEGVPSNLSRKIVEASIDVKKSMKRRQGIEKSIIGFFMVVVGVGISIFSHEISYLAGLDRYFVFWGLAVVGAIYLAQGLWNTITGI